eukprot:s4255_g4.t1
MIVYARTIYFVELVVDNPATALKKDDVLNRWTVGVIHNGFAPAQEIADQNLSTKQLQFCASPRDSLLCLEDLGTGYADALSVLGHLAILMWTDESSPPFVGKLSDFFIAPSQYGVGQLNTLSIFFLTEQEVGSLSNVETEVWVDAPSGFDFGQRFSRFAIWAPAISVINVALHFNHQLVMAIAIDELRLNVSLSSATSQFPGRWEELRDATLSVILVLFHFSLLRLWRYWRYLAGVAGNAPHEALAASPKIAEDSPPEEVQAAATREEIFCQKVLASQQMGDFLGAVQIFQDFQEETVQFSQAPSLLLRTLRLADDATGLWSLYEATKDHLEYSRSMFCLVISGLCKLRDVDDAMELPWSWSSGT